MSQPINIMCANAIRALAFDAVQQANSGHPGAPMGQADLAFVLWDEFLHFDPEDVAWAGRDLFVLSCGHASMLQYALIHLYGLGLEMNDLKNFRQLNSLTPGHPEVGHTKGVEVTTGPLGQGVANSVGMALAAQMMSARLPSHNGYNPAEKNIFAICSDGDLMEGLSSEAASLAGHWGLSNLVWLYDDNGITIDGSTDLAFSENIALRFESMGWRVLKIDGHEHEEIRSALKEATNEAHYPTLIICKTHIGYGSPNKVDSAASHGAPLGTDEIKATRAQLGWQCEPFEVPEAVKEHYNNSQERKRTEAQAWRRNFEQWSAAFPDARVEFDEMYLSNTPNSLTEALLDVVPVSGATRKLSQAAIAEIAQRCPNFVGGSADLTGSNGALIKNSPVFGKPSEELGTAYSGRQLYFGIREHAMAAIANGMILHGGFRPFTATFLVFSDYCRPSIRLAALSKLPTLFVFTHDSIFLGEDGPTHQPIEHHWALRMIPNLMYFRPADGVEVAMAWAYAMGRTDGPVAFGLTRQNLPALQRGPAVTPAEVLKGGYVLDTDDNADVTLIGTGSEVHLAVEVAHKLRERNIGVRVVSMPCVSLFLSQDSAVQEEILGQGLRVSLEAGTTMGWAQLTGLDGLQIGIDSFGASAPASDLAKFFGLHVEAVTPKIISALDGRQTKTAG